VTIRAPLGDATSSLGGAKSSLGIKSSLGGTKSSLGGIKSSLGGVCRRCASVSHVWPMSCAYWLVCSCPSISPPSSLWPRYALPSPAYDT
jgi:hypothetical protein